METKIINKRIKVVKMEKMTTNRQKEFTKVFLKDTSLSDRHLVYVSKEMFDLISKYLPVIGERKISFAGYFENIIRHHIESNKDVINELFENKTVKFFKL